MTSTNPGSRVGGFRREVDYQKLGPALLVALSLVLAIRTACWDLASIEWGKELRRLCFRIALLSIPISSNRRMSPGMLRPMRKCQSDIK